MATLTGNTIKDTYQSLLKVNDNGELAATLQEITDGVGNGSGVSLNTTGDLKAEGTIEFGSLKDTGEAITITKFVDEADGIANNDNDTSIPTSAAIIDYVAAKITEEDLDFAGDSGTGSVDLDSQIFTIGGTANQIETTASGQSLTLAFPSAGVVLPDGSTATTQATSDDSTKVATTAYVKSVLTQEDLDFQGDTGTGSVDLDSEVLDIAGGTGIDTVASGQTLTVNIDSTVATLTGTQTLTNKTINADNNTISNLEVDNLKAGVLDTDLTTVSASDDTLASAKAIKTYVDSQVTAQDLDITDGTTTSAVDLDSETMTIQGTANEVEVSLTDQTFTVGLPDTINVNVSGNITGDITGNADTASALQTARDIALSGDVAGSASFDGTTNITISATIQADSVALGTDTTGDYVANLGTGTGVTIASNTGEGSQPTIAVNYGSTANTAVQGNTEITINGTTNEIEITGTANQALGGAPSYTIGLPDDVTIGGSLIVSNDLTVNGTTTTVNTQTLSVEDPLIALAIANDANSVDTGFYAKYSLDAGVTTKFAGLFKDASDTDTFKLFKGLEVEPTTTVNTSGTGYALADIQVAGLEATTIVKTGGSSTEFLKADGSIDSNTYLTAESDTLDAVTTRGNTTSNSIQVAAATVTGDLTVDTNTLYVDSTNNRVGIGTLTPATALEIVNNTTNLARLRVGTTATTAGNFRGYEFASGSTFKGGLLQDESTDLISIFTPIGGQSVNIDSSGRVGIGVTPSTIWSTSYDALQIGLGGSIYAHSSAGSSVNLGANIVYEGTAPNYYDKYLTSSTASKYEQDAGDHIWSTASSGTAGNAVSWSERMRITNTGNVGIGTTSPSRIFTVSRDNTSSISASFVSANNQSAITLSGSATTSDTQVRLAAEGNDMLMYAGNSERMRIDSSGNVGIGTTSPSANLHIKSTGDTTLLLEADSDNVGEDDNPTITFSQDGGGVTATLGLEGTSGTVFPTSSSNGFYVDSTEEIMLGTAGTERLRIDSSGNAHLGYYTTQAANGLLDLTFINTNNTEHSGINFQTDASTGRCYINYERGSVSSQGSLIFGTSNTERVRIDSSGNVGINSTSPATKLEVSDSSSQAIITLHRTSGNTTGSFGALQWTASDNHSVAAIVGRADGNNEGAHILFHTTSAASSNDPYSLDERMRINSSGDVLIGGISKSTTPTLNKGVFLQSQTNGDVIGYSLYSNEGTNNRRASFYLDDTNGELGIASTYSSGAVDFVYKSAGTERMRITSGGDVYIKTTTLGGQGISFSGGSGTGIFNTNVTTSINIIEFKNPNGQVGRINTSGSSTSYLTSSDYRIKENVVELTGALDRVDALKPSRFNFIADPDKTVDGFLAHEVADVVPEAISGEKDAMRTEEYEVSPAVYEDVVHPAVEEVLDEDGNVVTPAQEAYTEKVLVSEAVMGTREVPEYQGIDQSKLVPVLTAALQEAHALIKDLTARVEALEN